MHFPVPLSWIDRTKIQAALLYFGSIFCLDMTVMLSNDSLGWLVYIVYSSAWWHLVRINLMGHRCTDSWRSSNIYPTPTCYFMFKFLMVQHCHWNCLCFSVCLSSFKCIMFYVHHLQLQKPFFVSKEQIYTFCSYIIFFSRILNIRCLSILCPAT